ncbi:magnesium chelatase subunit D [Actinoplanes campanulatus]|uniref:Mg-protoporphyrin IX chelatase n=1 Tax=Actinoplanes campanulatus TaxID=113559 RepID=A0A7W5AET1_9ACTN|nr:VWA domain-containing protein [Actinoplanes campanulatus]MBB3094997.1 magnesium chelatase subunit D [Actinoplanes campanulatus]GGN08825.1 hypothetical protein GCM10010109_17850 [Actinoplanes campanulatus]GID36292.1 hypothetical protein Aca09nite_27980 [Actinoplanes campanulatus]
MTTPYPFSAVVGLDDLRLALLLTSVSPAVGGVLVRGEKGTAKSTVVRALAGLLPPVTVVSGCRFACDPAAPDPACPDGPHPIPGRPDGPAGGPGHPAAPADAVAAATVRPALLVELPVGATEDRVVGTLDLQRALTDGVKAYEPGLLAAAHRGVLYVDEVNLLPDHLVDLLLDAAAMGRAHVERDGVSVKHAARFLLVGTMNPEEGEPRPQLVDRFGLVVNVAAPRDARQRAEVVRRRLAYEADPDGFAARYADAERDYAARIAAARAALPAVTLPDAELDRIARVCLAYGVDGMRADIVVARCAVALAAWHGRDRVTADDVRDAAGLALPHRRRTDPLDPPGTDEQKLEDALAEAERQAEQERSEQERAEQERADLDQAERDQADREQASQHGGDPDDEPDPDIDPDPDDGGPGGGGPRNDTPRDGGGPSGAGSPHGGTEESTPPSSNDEAPQPAKAGATATAGQAFRTRTLRITARGEGGHAGRRSPAFARRGRVVGSRVPQGKLSGAPHLFATLRAALDRAALDTITPTHPTPVTHATRNGTSHDQPSQDRVSQDRVSQDRVSQDRVSQEPVSQERVFQKRLSPDRLVGESVSEEGLSQGWLAQDQLVPGSVSQEWVSQERLVRGAGSEDQPVRERRGGIRVSPRDLRESVHVGREANLVLFVVDASGSMAARKRMTLVKTAVLSLLRDAYQRRDRIGMITFRGRDAEVVLPPTSSHEVGVMRLAALRTGGRTPLAAGLRAAAATIATERRRDPRRRPLLVVVTDGRATSGPDPVLLAPALAGVATVVVDCESGQVRLGLAGKLAAVLRADLMPLEHLQATTVLHPTARAATALDPADRAYRAAA